MRAWDRIEAELGLIEGVARWRFRRIGTRRFRADLMRRARIEWGDLFHDTLIEVERFARDREFESDEHFRNWVKVRARGALLDVWRRVFGTWRFEGPVVWSLNHVSSQALETVAGEDVPASPGPTPAESAETGEERDRLWLRVRAALNPREYAVVRLWADLARSTATGIRVPRGTEAHRMLGIASGTWGVQLANAQRKLRAALA